MGVLTKLLSKLKVGSINNNNCYFCKRKTSDMRYYKNEQNKKIGVCSLCVEYAERRVLRKY